MNKIVLAALFVTPILFTSCETKSWIEVIGDNPLEMVLGDTKEAKIATHPAKSGLTEKDFKVTCHSETHYCSVSFKQEDKKKGVYIFEVTCSENKTERELLGTARIDVVYKNDDALILVDIYSEQSTNLTKLFESSKIFLS